MLRSSSGFTPTPRKKIFANLRRSGVVFYKDREPKPAPAPTPIPRGRR